MRFIKFFGIFIYKRIIQSQPEINEGIKKTEKKNPWCLVDFAVLTDHRVKIKERNT